MHRITHPRTHALKSMQIERERKRERKRERENKERNKKTEQGRTSRERQITHAIARHDLEL